jgi:hypothetical protein
MTTFIENFKGKFGLTEKQTETLLEHYKKLTIISFSKSLFYYLKKSAIKQYKEILGKDIDESDIVLPFLLSDRCMRDHFEKNINGQWYRVIIYDNIYKILDFVENLIYINHSKSLLLNADKKKKIINLLLKKSIYPHSIDISIPELYKAII